MSVALQAPALEALDRSGFSFQTGFAFSLSGSAVSKLAKSLYERQSGSDLLGRA